MTIEAELKTKDSTTAPQASDPFTPPTASRTKPHSVFTDADLSRPFTPLKIPLFRSFWIAGLVSNMGTWMHETGAQWLMTSIEPSPEMVAAVRTSMTIPVFCLALPAGVWADRFDRRTWLMGTQLLLLGIAGLMASLVALDLMSPWLLLALTAAMGVGMILNQPAWQSLTPELVPPALVPSAVSVGSISFNLARSLGPLVGGLLIASVGIWSPFVFNAFSFLAVIMVLIIWKDELSAKTKRKRSRSSSRRFWGELAKGLFVVKRSKEIRNVLIRLFLFAFPASILWSLLALVATEKLGFQERGFGMCLGIIGAGAVSGATFLPYLRTKFSSEAIVFSSKLCFAFICCLIGFTNSRFLIVPGLALIGTCWMATMTTLNATAQVYLPKRYRARGMAAYMMAFALGLGAGSAAWGWFALWTSLGTAYIVSGLMMAGVSVALHGLKIGSLHLPENR